MPPALFSSSLKRKPSTVSDDDPEYKSGQSKKRARPPTTALAKRRKLEDYEALVLTPELRLALEGVLQAVIKSESAIWFLQPVPEKDFPNYREFVSTPMDFSTISAKLANYTSVGDLIQDMDLIWANARKYSPPQSKVCTDTTKTEKFFLSAFETGIKAYLNALPGIGLQYLLSAGKLQDLFDRI
jgi:hypothetical protein